jgi:hypothetical protein
VRLPHKFFANPLTNMQAPHDAAAVQKFGKYTVNKMCAKASIWVCKASIFILKKKKKLFKCASTP